MTMLRIIYWTIISFKYCKTFLPVFLVCKCPVFLWHFYFPIDSKLLIPFDKIYLCCSIKQSVKHWALILLKKTSFYFEILSVWRCDCVGREKAFRGAHVFLNYMKLQVFNNIWYFTDASKCLMYSLYKGYCG